MCHLSDGPVEPVTEMMLSGFSQYRLRISRGGSPTMTRTLLDGNEAIARAAVNAGCRFFAGYPITPATSILHYMLEMLPCEGGVCMQGEDEISSIGFCLGASMSGVKAMTATSGPGISLCSEQISFAIGGEIPLVIVDVQRLGPSTGSATKGADGDIQFLRWGNSGGLPVIVLAPEDAADCYLLTTHAFNLAEEFRCPVFIASNKEVGLTRESIDPDLLQLPEIIKRKETEEGEVNLPFELLSGESVPRFLPIGGRQLSRQTSSTHGEDGYITTDPAAIEAGIRRMTEKLHGAGKRFSYYELQAETGDDCLLIVYGVTARAARAAVRRLRGTGCKISLLVLKTLYPVPEEVIINAAGGKEKIFVAEMNVGQYVIEIKRLIRSVPVRFIGQMNGELIRPETIVKEVAL